jgi:hypothetical protein
MRNGYEWAISDFEMVWLLKTRERSDQKYFNGVEKAVFRLHILLTQNFER